MDILKLELLDIKFRVQPTADRSKAEISATIIECLDQEGENLTAETNKGYIHILGIDIDITNLALY